MQIVMAVCSLLLLVEAGALIWIIYDQARRIRVLQADLRRSSARMAEIETVQIQHTRSLESAARLIRERPVGTFMLPPRPRN